MKPNPHITAHQKPVTVIALFCLCLSACQPGKPATPSPIATSNKPTATFLTPATPSPTHTSVPTLAPSSTPTPQDRLWIAPYLPKAFQNLSLPATLELTVQREDAQILLDVGDHHPIGYWIFALVAPFPTILDGVSSDELHRAWKGDTQGLFSGKPLLLSKETLALLSVWWGQSAEGAVSTLPTEELVQSAWENRPAWAIIPFEELSPRWKVLEIDGQSPLRKEFNLEAYALSLPVSLSSLSGAETDNFLSGQKLLTNRDPDRLTTLILTGVTALVRGTALTMESKGVTYPGEAIAPWLRQADFTHISNEIPFYDGCPYPVMYPTEIRFCSAPRYIGLLEDIGADIIELTGDHFSDYGPEALFQTLKMYKERGWYTYGGGANAPEARQPVLLEHNHNRLAILGCNAKGIPYYAQASDTEPGAVACDFDLLTGEIEQLRNDGYLVIVTFQDVEYSSYTAQPKLVEDFHRAALAGATIVSGSQAHQPHGMEFLGDTFIHYGLGNLFFDQYRFVPGGELDRAFIDRHVFYDGKYIGTELLTIQFVDLARPRPTTPEERQDFLKIIFSASGW